MNTKNTKVVTDQKLFFNMASAKELIRPFDQFLMEYVNRQQYDCFDWLSDTKTLLDYGCGNAESVDVLLEKHPKERFKIIGVDIAEEAVKHAQKRYPQFSFFTIKNNTIPQIKNASMEGAYMIHVLHHAEGHQEIFDTIASKLKPGGKFFLNDLTSQNPFISLGRFFFTKLPGSVQQKFSDDLVVDGQIPDKYRIDIPTIVKQLKKAGFTVEKVGYGHLFFFLFTWVDRFIPLSKFPRIRSLYRLLINLENTLLQYSFFQKYAEVVYIRAIKL